MSISPLPNRLGYHQDKDETAESLAKGLPVVSISLGDSADFLFGQSSNEHAGQTIKLSSGDVVVFGGEIQVLLVTYLILQIGFPSYWPSSPMQVLQG